MAEDEVAGPHFPPTPPVWVSLPPLEGGGWNGCALGAQGPSSSLCNEGNLALGPQKQCGRRNQHGTNTCEFSRNGTVRLTCRGGLGGDVPGGEAPRAAWGEACDVTRHLLTCRGSFQMVLGAPRVSQDPLLSPADFPTVLCPFLQSKPHSHAHGFPRAHPDPRSFGE